MAWKRKEIQLIYIYIYIYKINKCSKRKKTYHIQVSLQAEEDLMLPYGSKVNHVLGKQQRLLHRINNVPSCALLEVSDRGIT